LHLIAPESGVTPSEFAISYLNSSYPVGKPYQDTKLILNFVAREIKGLRERLGDPQEKPAYPTALEIGCGSVPISCASVCEDYHILQAGYLSAELHLIANWINGDPGAHDWNAYIAEALKCELFRNPTEDEVAARTKLLKEKITLSLCDITQEYPLGTASEFPLATSFYATEVAARGRDDWYQIIKNIGTTVAPEGTLLMAFTSNLKRYTLYDEDGESREYPLYAINSEDILTALEKAGFNPDEITVERKKITQCELTDDGITEIILVAAKKSSRAVAIR